MDPRGEEKSVAGSIQSTRGRYRRVCAVLVIAALLLAVPAGAYNICYGKACTTGVTCCSGHGTCTGYNKCTCNTGFTGSECEDSTFCGMSAGTPVCTTNCTPWGSSVTTASHGTCISNPLSGTLSDATISYTVNRENVSNICACTQGWTGACCTNYQPGTLTPSVLDFGNVTVGAPAGSTADVLLANTMANTNLTVQSISLAGTNSGDFAYTTTCAANTKVTSFPGNCTFAVTFTPSATGTRIATLSVNVTGDSTNYQVLTTTLTGTGITQVSSILVNPLDDTNIFAGLEGAGIYRSTDSGSTWTSASLSPATTQVTALVRQAGTGSTALYAGTIGGGVYTSTDNGVSWTVCSNTGLTNTNVRSLVANSSGALFAGTDDGVFVSTDACADWTATNTGLP